MTGVYIWPLGQHSATHPFLQPSNIATLLKNMFSVTKHRRLICSSYIKSVNISVLAMFQVAPLKELCDMFALHKLNCSYIVT